MLGIEERKLFLEHHQNIFIFSAYTAAVFHHAK